MLLGWVYPGLEKRTLERMKRSRREYLEDMRLVLDHVREIRAKATAGCLAGALALATTGILSRPGPATMALPALPAAPGCALCHVVTERCACLTVGAVAMLLAAAACFGLALSKVLREYGHLYEVNAEMR